METEDHSSSTPDDPDRANTAIRGAVRPPSGGHVTEVVTHAVAELQAEIESTKKSIQADLESADGQFPKLFYTKSLEETNQVIDSYEMRTNAKFVVYKESKFFGQNEPLHFMACKKEGDGHRVNHRISWEDRETSLALYNRVPYDGVPFMLLGRKIYDCHLGVQRDKRKRDDSKKQRKSSGSRKVGCTARITLREIQKFPEFQIQKGNGSYYFRAHRSMEIRKAILNREEIGERRIYVSLPSVSDHSIHDVTRVDNFLTDPRIKKKIYELTYQRVFTIRDLRTMTREYVERELFKGVDLPSETDTRFHPSDTTFKNISYLARLKMKKEGIPMPESRRAKTSRKPVSDTNVPHIGQEITVASSPPPSPTISVTSDPPDDVFTLLGEIQGFATNVEDSTVLENLREGLQIIRNRLKQEVGGGKRPRLALSTGESDFIANEGEGIT